MCIQNWIIICLINISISFLLSFGWSHILSGWILIILDVWESLAINAIWYFVLIFCFLSVYYGNEVRILFSISNDQKSILLYYKNLVHCKYPFIDKEKKSFICSKIYPININIYPFSSPFKNRLALSVRHSFLLTFGYHIFRRWIEYGHAFAVNDSKTDIQMRNNGWISIGDLFILPTDNIWSPTSILKIRLKMWQLSSTDLYYMQKIFINIISFTIFCIIIHCKAKGVMLCYHNDWIVHFNNFMQTQYMFCAIPEKHIRYVI